MLKTVSIYGLLTNLWKSTTFEERSHSDKTYVVIPQNSIGTFVAWRLECVLKYWNRIQQKLLGMVLDIYLQKHLVLSSQTIVSCHCCKEYDVESLQSWPRGGGKHSIVPSPPRLWYQACPREQSELVLSLYSSEKLQHLWPTQVSWIVVLMVLDYIPRSLVCQLLAQVTVRDLVHGSKVMLPRP